MNSRRTMRRIIFSGLAAVCGMIAQAGDWAPAAGPLLTRWAKDVSPSKVHQEYPRPQMVRQDWQNLNGLWDYAIQTKEAAKPEKWDGKILVPFPIESALSGVMKPVGETNRLWYRRTFKAPGSWKGRRLLVHFGAVDWEATVYVNGKEIGSHRGGYDGFSFDITDALNSSSEQEMVVAVWDPTDAATQPRGKQVRNPHGIWYTPTTGIWQTPWLEPADAAHIEGLRITPDLDQSAVSVQVNAQGAGAKTTVRVEVLDGKKSIQSGEVTVEGAAGKQAPKITLKVPDAKLWSPDSPFLYGLKITMSSEGKQTDQVESYFGMRKIALGKDEQGVNRLFLNNKALFQFGPLDQGFWPDGLYTAPTDEALRYDIEMTKKLGYNMARKHVKVEPARWYYWCDKLGLLVWQDMPSGDRYIGGRDPDIQRTPESGKQFETELKALVDSHYNAPSIVIWVPYNEGWGQWDTARIVDLIKGWDPSRLVINASGWTDRRVGDIMDIHSYPGPAAPRVEEKRASVLGEFGGLGLPVRGHTWQQERNWGYRSFTNPGELTDAYLKLIDRLRPLIADQGLAAAVYTQTTDVEIEVNGLMTYDRAQVKMDEKTITEANKSVYKVTSGRKQAKTLIPPATPLVACDPYFSIWSFNDRLTDDTTRHWTGREHGLVSLIRIDGKTFRLMGADPRRLPALPQVDLKIFPTRSVYEFEGEGVRVKLTFLTPALPQNLEIYARPVTYLTWDVRSAGNKERQVELYFDHAADLVVNEPRQQVTWETLTIPGAGGGQRGLIATKVGSREQPVLMKRGDDLRIDWGYAYGAAPQGEGTLASVASGQSCRNGFIENAKLPLPDTRQPRAANDESPVAAFAFSLGKVGSKGATRWMALAYDDLYSIQYFQKNLRPYWRKDGADAAKLLLDSAAEYESLHKRCAAFDEELIAEMTRLGGTEYAAICALAYRQSAAANKLVADANGQPLLFPKENFSNGCIGTVDVIYPMAPQYLLFSPSLTKAMLVPIMDYANSGRWKFPFAPHDLGTYPLANGQVYGGGERTEENQMPVEESGNMLILLAALAQIEGNAKFVEPYWPILEKWADYLRAKGFDPENQLCTDDFAGHLAHNVNLSAKAICGLASFAKLCQMRGLNDLAQECQKLAGEFSKRWIQEAADGDHYRLAFDKPGTWSQKYNLVWDRILGLNLFPEEVLRKEMDFYKKSQNRYGLPLDNRQPYTKLDWTIWTATLTQNRSDFDALVAPVYRFLNETPDRVPMTDWFFTHNGRKAGFQARSVVGGVFIQALQDRATWAKWAKRDEAKPANWAPLPKPPKVTVVLPTAQNQTNLWRYTTVRPANGWQKPGFDVSGWKEAPAGFGTQGTPGAVVRTEWNSQEIWLRRDVDLTGRADAELRFFVHHDEDVEIYINGVLAGAANGYTTSYETMPLSPDGKKALKPGRNALAVHCRQTGGGQYIDVGLVEVTEE